ncbi:MAG: nucleotidyltransferase domain-containing protein [Bdellovibrionota bacterium]
MTPISPLPPGIPGDLIRQRLAQIEAEEDVRILLAVESGSRSWGFASTDSDFDVRFIYVRREDWYLTIDAGRDVIERPIDDADVDLSGWDLKKALVLFRKSNPPLLEWLQSPIIYVEKFTVAETLRQMMPTSYSPIACMHHYLHMAQANFREYLRGETVRLKKYFYVLRPVLACAWVHEGFGVAPMEFHRLIDRLLPTGPVRESVDALLARKMSGGELDNGPRIQVLNDYLESEISRLEQSLPASDRAGDMTPALNRVFRDGLKEVWLKS